MAYEYDNDNGLRQPQPPKKDSDIGSWIFIAVMFTVAWPIGLILLLINLFLIFVGMFMETIAAILILLIGHGLNIVMGLLSVVVHGVRLNLLEFSGQLGMEWAGIAYDPFKKRDKIKK